MNHISLLLLLACYFFYEGSREAYYYHSVSQLTGDKRNIHWVYVVQRMLLLGICINLHADWFTLLSAAFIFPFMHDGAYYTVRNFLNNSIYQKKFFADSTTSTAFFELKLPVRLTLFGLGIAIFITHLIIN